MDSVALSLTVALAATLVTLPIGVTAAWFLERSRSSMRGAVHTAVMLPLVLPPVVTGYLLLYVFSPNAVIGRALTAAGAPVAFHWLGAVVASAVVGFPLLVLSVSLAIRAVDRRLEDVSRTLGRTPWQTFQRVTLPLAWPGILAGATLAFARGLGEFGATIVLAGRIPGETETIALRIYAELDAPGGERRIAGLVVASLLLCAASVFVARWLDGLHRRRLEREP